MSQDEGSRPPTSEEQAAGAPGEIQTGPVTDQEGEHAIQKGREDPGGSSAADVEQSIADIEEKRARG